MNTQSSEGFKIRPPLGIVPEWVWKEQRHKELDDAIHRYIAAGEAIPVNWIAEHYAIGQWIRNREEEKSYTSKDNLASGSNVAGNGKDWEIVSFKGVGGFIYNKTSNNDNFTCFENFGHGLHNTQWFMDKQGYFIYSVKRLPDGVVFSIGDETNYGIIEKFFIGWAGMEVHFTNGCGATLASMEKNKKPEALFKDYLGNDVFKGDKFWFVEHNFEIGEAEPPYYSSGRYDERKDFKYFSTKLAAHQYVSENKPQFSIKDFKDILKRYDYAIDMMEEVFTDLKYLGKLNDKK